METKAYLGWVDFYMELADKLLPYARTEEEIQPDNVYMMSGNMISVKTLNLDCEFSEIASQLNSIAGTFLHG